MNLAKVKLTVNGQSLAVDVLVPGTGPATDVLPALFAVTDAIVDAGTAGLAVSCRKGCGACCRQMVPIAFTEAQHLRQLLDRMDDERREFFEQRFAAAREALNAKGLLGPLQQRATLSDDALYALDVEYLKAWVACPFLVDESCAIHAARPMACREFLVTSPAEFCAEPTADRVEQVPLGAKVSTAFRAVAEGGDWIPLVLALEESAGTTPAEVDGPSLLTATLQAL